MLVFFFIRAISVLNWWNPNTNKVVQLIKNAQLFNLLACIGLHRSGKRCRSLVTRVHGGHIVSRATRSVRFTLFQRKLLTVVGLIQLLNRQLTVLGVNRQRIKRPSSLYSFLLHSPSCQYCEMVLDRSVPCNYMYLNKDNLSSLLHHDLALKQLLVCPFGYKVSFLKS